MISAMEQRVRHYWTLRSHDFGAVRKNELENEMGQKWLREIERLLPENALQQENDEITLTMDIGQLRPAWDMRVLRRIGFSDCRSDATVGQRILGALDLTHAPMFGIWARKA